MRHIPPGARFLLTAAVVLCPTAPSALAQMQKVPVIIDTDFGSDIDDAFALALALASPELDVRAITTVGKQAADRAAMVCRFLTQCGRGDIPVAAGAEPAKSSGIDWQIQYRRHPAVVFHRAGRPEKRTAAELMQAVLMDGRGEVTVIALGPLTNVAELLDRSTHSVRWFKQLVVMGGAIRVGYNGKPPAEPEWNIDTDVKAARRVLASGVPITLIPLDATAAVRLEQAERERIFDAGTPLTYQVQGLYELWGKETPVLFDPVAVAAAFQRGFWQFANMEVKIDAFGITRAVESKRDEAIRVATSISREPFLSWFVQRLAATGAPVLPKPPGNLAKLVDRGGFPAQVHVVEDYDTDIEKRWWLAGKLEQKDVLPGGGRACRATLTQDFDDRQGDTKATYRAVVFNPVPGPPMGPNTRLAFRYKITGTDRLRVQLYSLSNGYHRYLSLAGLPTGRWESAAVDMTQMRRPDGTGGPLAADERIDDIQFYIDPRGELLIDDIVLYDAAASDERRPFPHRIVFTGWFDTGKQGQEWPGDFEIVPHEKPLQWKYAKSVVNILTNTPWVRVKLRGDRWLDDVTELRFRYRLTGAAGLRVELGHRKSGWSAAHDLPDVRQGEWTTATLRFDTVGMKPVTADEVRFLVPAGGELGVDDVLLYTPARN